MFHCWDPYCTGGRSLRTSTRGSEDLRIFWACESQRTFACSRALVPVRAKTHDEHTLQSSLAFVLTNYCVQIGQFIGSTTSTNAHLSQRPVASYAHRASRYQSCTIKASSPTKGARPAGTNRRTPHRPTSMNVHLLTLLRSQTFNNYIHTFVRGTSRALDRPAYARLGGAS